MPRLLLILLAGLLLSTTVLVAEDKPSVPEHVTVSLGAEAENYVLGDNALVTVTVAVTAGEAVFEYGRDHFNPYRSRRWIVTATGPDGTAVADPHPGPWYDLGGVTYRDRLTPATPSVHQVPLGRYLLLDRPGKYVITVSHDGGWRATPERPLPTASITLAFRAPAPAETTALVAAWRILEGRQVRPADQDPRTCPPPHPDWQSIRHPTFLPALMVAAEDGSPGAVFGVASIETPEATTALLDLAGRWQFEDRGDPKPLLEALAVRATGSRHPDIYYSYHTEDPPYWYWTRQHRLTWLPDFAERTMLFAERTLEIESLTDRSTDVLVTLGMPETLPVLLVALDRRLAEDSAWTFRHDTFPQWNAASRLLEAVDQAVQRGGRPPAVPAGPAQSAAWTMALRQHPESRPDDWIARAEVLLNRDDPCALTLVLENLPRPFSAALRPHLYRLVAHEHPRVAYTAAGIIAVEHLGEREDGAAALMAALAISKNSWVLERVFTSLPANREHRLEATLLVVDRMAEPELTNDLIRLLAMRHFERDFHLYSGAGSFCSHTEESAQACAAAWRTFVQQYGEAFPGKRWSLPDQKVPDALAGGNRLTLFDGMQWPAEN